MTTLVTGASGCLGAPLTRALVERGERVRVLVPNQDGAGDVHGAALSAVADHVEVVRGDVRDAEAVDRAVERVHTVFHLAGITGLTTARAATMDAVNRVGTATLMEAALRAGARVVHTSSTSVLGTGHGEALVDETVEVPPAQLRHPYARTKRHAELEVLARVARGLDAVIVIPGAVLAPGGAPDNSWGAIARAVAAGRFPLAPPGSTGFIGGTEMVQAHLNAREKGRAGERYLAVSEDVRYRDLLAGIADRVGVRRPRATAPAWTIRGAARLAAVGRARRGPGTGLLDPAVVPLLVDRHRHDCTKAVRELGFRPAAIGRALDALVAGV